jgi:hypothetical protein
MHEIIDDYFGLIKFGEEFWLKKIKEGKLWFRNLEYYQNYEDDNNIGDKNEGLSHIFYPDESTKFYFSHPTINDGKNFEISNIVGPVCDFPNYNKSIYIFCLSYFTIKDVMENTIYDDCVLGQANWNSVFFFLNPIDFINIVRRSLDKYNVNICKIQYFDYSKNQDGLNVFSKSDKYSYQKEIRIAFQYTDNEDWAIKRINGNTLEITLAKDVDGIVMPTDSFREGFVVENAEGDKECY